MSLRPGETIMQAAAAGRLHPAPVLAPGVQAARLVQAVHGEGQRPRGRCLHRAGSGRHAVERDRGAQRDRATLLQMLFVEGNHFCPSCEKSGNCQLQAVAYEARHADAALRRTSTRTATVDASHPDVLLDFNRCILCELCVRASRDVDGKNVFASAGAASTGAS
jgi:[NiFe] hydrogenase diaphorase moiety small subunit